MDINFRWISLLYDLKDVSCCNPDEIATGFYFNFDCCCRSFCFYVLFDKKTLG